MNFRTAACAAVVLTTASASPSLQVVTALVARVDHDEHLLSPMLAAAC
jgi:hypothetical protein